MRSNGMIVGALLIACPGSAVGQSIPAATGASASVGSANGLTQTASTSSSTYTTLDTLNFTVSPDSSGVFTVDASAAVGLSAPFPSGPSFRILLNGTQAGNGFGSYMILNRNTVASGQLTLSGLAPGNHQLALQWMSGSEGNTITMNSRSLRLTGYNQVGGQSAATVWMASAGSPTGFGQTATLSSYSYTNLQTINFNVGPESSGLFNASSSISLVQSGNGGQGIIRLRYLLDGVQYGNAVTYISPNSGSLNTIPMLAQISGLSAGNHQLAVQWSKISTSVDYVASTQDLRLTGYNIVNGVPAAKGWSVSAGDADGMNESATTSSTAYVDLQTINFTADELSSGLFDVAGSLTLGPGSNRTAGIRYLLDGVQVGPGFSTVLNSSANWNPLSFPFQLTGVTSGDHVFTVQWASLAGGAISAYGQFFSITGFNNFSPVPEASAFAVVGLALGAWMLGRRVMSGC